MKNSLSLKARRLASVVVLVGLTFGASIAPAEAAKSSSKTTKTTSSSSSTTYTADTGWG